MNEYKKSDGKNPLLCCAVGIGVSMLMSPVLLAVLTAFAMLSPDPASMAYLGCVALYLSCTLCGFVSARGYGKKPLLCGLLSGIIYASCLLGVSALASNGDTSPLTPLPCPLCSVVGAYLGCAKLVPGRRKRPDISGSNKLYRKYKK